MGTARQQVEQTCALREESPHGSKSCRAASKGIPDGTREPAPLERESRQQKGDSHNRPEPNSKHREH